MTEINPAARPSALAWFLLIFLALLWGSSFFLMFEGLKAFNALELAAIRMGVAAICLLPFLYKYVRLISWRDWGLLSVIGLAGNAIPAYLFAQSETQLPTAVVGVLNSLSPIFTLIIGFFFFQMRTPAKNVVGVGLGFTGATILALAGSKEADVNTNLSFALLVVVATLCYGISTNLIKNYFAGRDPIMITTIALSTVGWPAIAFLFLGTDVTHKLATYPEATTAFGYIAILGALGTAFGVVLFNRLLQISSIVFATSVTYLIPVVAVVWGVFLKEELNKWHGVGFLVILVGVWLANRK
jgi:drug/metabolite transporter (DMT)-like permease